MSTSGWPGNPLDWSIISGPVWTVAVLFTGAAMVLLVVRRGRRWWLRSVPLSAIVAGVVITMALLWIEVWWKPFPDTIPLEVTAWAAVAIGGISLAAARMRPLQRWRVRIGHLGLAVVVVVGGLLGINHYYGEFPDLRSAFGLHMNDETTLEQIPVTEPVAPAKKGATLASSWKPPVTMPAIGVVVPVDIPGTVSHFKPQEPEWVYLPPAYLVSPRPLLPVLVLLSGQPGTPRDWLSGGQLAKRMDAWAADHHGLAPVVVMPDYLGKPLANTLCVNSPLGNADTYLSVDVPQFIRTSLQVTADLRLWAVGGFSAGGTCALQLGTLHSAVFPTILSISGSPVIWKDDTYTIAHYFKGSEADFRRLNPIDVLGVDRFPHSTAAIFDAVHDPHPEYRPMTVTACEKAGMTVFSGVVAGNHSWTGWGGEATLIFPWLFHRWGLGS